jgi:divalent metal cation (Fe/Co/Zn/Cd) transporter
MPLMDERRRDLLRRGLLLEGFTVAWNVLEGIVAVAAGLLSNSVALIGFGIDSFVETTSAVVVGWRLRTELRGGCGAAAQRAERSATRVAGALLLVLALYIVVDAGRRLLGLGAEAERSIVGIALTAISLAVMPFLGWAKLRTARALESRALRADAYETIACAWLSLTTLVGLALNALVGWWWADPLAALCLVPMIVREGLEGWRGGCCDHDGCDA